MRKIEEKEIRQKVIPIIIIIIIIIALIQSVETAQPEDANTHIHIHTYKETNEELLKKLYFNMTHFTRRYGTRSWMTDCLNAF